MDRLVFGPDQGLQILNFFVLMWCQSASFAIGVVKVSLNVIYLVIVTVCVYIVGHAFYIMSNDDRIWRDMVHYVYCFSILDHGFMIMWLVSWI